MATTRRTLALVALSFVSGGALSGSALAQTSGTISGTVTDSVTGYAIQGARIVIEGTTYGSLTRANGSYAILRVPPGVYNLVFQHNDYVQIKRTGVDVRADVNRVIHFVALPAPTPPALLGAQQVSAPQAVALQPTTVRLFPLQHLSNADAAKLIAPFTNQPAEQVYEPGEAVRGVTVRASVATLAKIDSLLALHDQPLVTVLLRFQVIAATDSTTRDPQIGPEVLIAMREALPYAGYRSVAATSLSVSPGAGGRGSRPGLGFSTTLNGEGEQLRLSGDVTTIGVRALTQSRSAGPRQPTSVSLTVNLTGLLAAGLQGAQQWQPLISTSLSVPIGQTVVIGSAATSTNHKALILIVKPEVR